MAFEVSSGAGRTFASGLDLNLYFNTDVSDTLPAVARYNNPPTADLYYIQAPGVYLVEVESVVTITAGTAASELQLRSFGGGDFDPTTVLATSGPNVSLPSRTHTISYEWTVTAGDLDPDPFAPEGPADVVYFQAFLVNGPGLGGTVQSGFLRVTPAGVTAHWRIGRIGWPRPTTTLPVIILDALGDPTPNTHTMGGIEECRIPSTPPAYTITDIANEIEEWSIIGGGTNDVIIWQLTPQPGRDYRFDIEVTWQDVANSKVNQGTRAFWLRAEDAGVGVDTTTGFISGPAAASGDTVQQISVLASDLSVWDGVNPIYFRVMLNPYGVAGFNASETHLQVYRMP